jgi:predicted short-subunit dehydrogenase-like oxidoreductase (DUF2520 family)
VASIAIAGAGPVAQSLGWLLSRSGYPVQAVASRSRERAEQGAAFIGTAPVGYEDIGRLSLPTIIAVTDAALPAVAARLASATGAPAVAVHTCGVHGPDVLQPLADKGWSVGVMHPLQTIPTPEHGTRSLPGAAFGIGGATDAVAFASALVGAVGGRAINVRPDAFPLYHAAAVVAGNGIFALVEAASAMMAEAGVEPDEVRSVLEPLARTSLTNAFGPDGDHRLTGPVARGDTATVGAHMAALITRDGRAVTVEQTGERALLYAALTSWLLRIARRRGLAATSTESIAALVRIPSHGGTP